MATTETWSDPSQCPFCDTALASPGAGFVDHLDDSDDCRTEFDVWRGRVADDLGGAWTG